MFVLYDYDSNVILVQAIPNQTSNSILGAYCTLLQHLQWAGITSSLQHMDNEASQALKDYIKEQQINYQLMPAHQHWRNAAKLAIRTFKNHFLAILAGADPKFPMHLWDHLLL